MTKRIADQLVETLVRVGVKRMYGLAGDSLNAIIDSVRRDPKIEWIHVRHEETAAFAAGAEAYLTEKLAVCAGSCGPGNMHLINGLYDAHRSRVPVLAIATQIPSKEIGTQFFQETDPKHLFAQCSFYCETITSVEQMPRILNIAIQTALSKRGVAVVVLPGDIALEAARLEAEHQIFVEPQNHVSPPEHEIEKLAQILNEAKNKKITILAGIGCAKAHDELVALAEKLQAPIVHSLRGKECIEYDNPYNVGLTGLLGFSSGYYAMMHCDVLLMLGTDFPYQQFYPEHCKSHSNRYRRRTAW